LKQCFDVGAPVPQPFTYQGNLVVMGFIGVSGIPAPRLIDADVDKRDYLRITKAMELIYKKAELVHSDLSEYNVLKYNNELRIKDFGSAVSNKHPSAVEFLIRDITNINKFFEKKGISVTENERLLLKIRGGRV
jgi:RIO kinase 1